MHTRTIRNIVAILILAGLFHGSAAFASDAPDAAGIMRQVLANRPAISLWLEAELTVQRRTADRYDLHIFLNGRSKPASVPSIAVTDPEEAAGTTVLMIEDGDTWLCEKNKTEPRKLTPVERATPFLGGDFGL